MATKKTSAELAREEAEANQLDNMLGNAFGDAGGISSPVVEEIETPSEQAEMSLDEAPAPSGPN